MIRIGEYNTLKVSRMVDFGAYLESEGEEVLIPGKWIPEGTEPGQELRVFVYTDSEDRIIATTMEPAAVLGEFAALKVKAVTPFGAFLDWGLEKDLLLPKNEQLKPVSEGEKVVVRIAMDYKTNRLIGVSKIGAFLKAAGEGLVPGQEVNLLVFHKSPLGYQVMVDGKYNGLLYNDQVFEDLQIGDERKGFIRKVREDGKLDVNLKAFGKEGMKSDKDRVFEKLQENGGILPYGDKSEADDINTGLNMSKKSYKRAIGMLYKERKITISDFEIRLQE